MGAPGSGMKAVDQPAAESLLTAFKNLSAAERRRHASVLNYWLSVRGDKEFPPLHDLDPLELSDAGPNSVLLELISGGHDAEVRHLGEALRDEAWPERIIDAPNPSVLACIAKKLPIVAISRDFLAFEDEYEGPNGKVSCSVTLLPLSAGGAWVDYVYALVSVDGTPAKAAKPESGKKAKAAAEPAQEPEVVEEPEVVDEAVEEAETVEPVAEDIEEPVAEEAEDPVAEVAEPAAAAGEPVETDVVTGKQPEPVAEEPVVAAVAKAAPGFSKLLDSIAGLTGFYGSQPVKVEPVAEEPVAEAPLAEESFIEEQTEKEPAAEESVVEEHIVEEATADEPVDQPMAQVSAEKPAAKRPRQPAQVASEGTLQNKLTEVRAKADEARMARLKAQAALYQGLAAAYDFALDAEEAPEEYLRLVEAQGLKIQLRSPMKPVVKLAFAGMCDEATIKQLEAVLAWAFDEELPRGALAERIESAGGIAPILQAKAA